MEVFLPLNTNLQLFSRNCDFMSRNYAFITCWCDIIHVSCNADFVTNCDLWVYVSQFWENKYFFTLKLINESLFLNSENKSHKSLYHCSEKKVARCKLRIMRSRSYLFSFYSVAETGFHTMQWKRRKEIHRREEFLAVSWILSGIQAVQTGLLF